MATILGGGKKAGQKATIGLKGKGSDIPMESPKVPIEIKVRSWPDASKKT